MDLPPLAGSQIPGSPDAWEVGIPALGHVADADESLQRSPSLWILHGSWAHNHHLNPLLRLKIVLLEEHGLISPNSS